MLSKKVTLEKDFKGINYLANPMGGINNKNIEVNFVDK
jgi:hypothetical protein